eukprot:gene27953-33756_t
MIRLDFLVLVVSFFKIVLSKCPNSCSGHGQCGVGNLCNCYEGWTGGAVDCSLRSCAIGTAWVDKAYATDSAHQQAECSNAGLCDRSTGVCQCFSGFTGAACQRSQCPNACSGHGTCSSIGDVSQFWGPDYDSPQAVGGDGFGPVYSNWDRGSVHLCECEQGYFGADCSLIMCPKGDDPLTINQNSRAISFLVGTEHGPLMGAIGLRFQGTDHYLSLSNYTSKDCSADLSFIGKFGLVSCTSNYVSLRRRSFDISFLSWPVYPKENNLFAHSGNPALADFTCTVAQATKGTFCVFRDVVVDNIREYKYCSNRGHCDFSTGRCDCTAGFGGVVCSNRTTAIYTPGASALPGLTLNADSTTYVATVLPLQSAKDSAPDFNFVEAVASKEPIFSVRGDGAFQLNSLLSTNGQTVVAGGLMVRKGGLTTLNGGVTIVDNDPETPVLNVTSNASSVATTYAALRLQSESTWANNHFLLTATNRGQIKFRLRADGALSMRLGLQIQSGGLSVLGNGLTTRDGFTVQSGSLNILQGGARMAQGALVRAGGVFVASGGYQIYESVQVYDVGMKVVAGGRVFAGGLLVTGGGSISGSLQVTGSISVLSAGGNVIGGITVLNAMSVIAGSVQVNAQGVRVTGGLSVQSGGAVVNGGISVLSSGLRVTEGATVSSLGVSTNTVSSADDMTVTGGMSVAAGAHFHYGCSVQSGGLVVTGGISSLNSLITAASGLQLSGGLTITGGLSVVGSSTFSSGSITTSTASSGGTVGNGVVVSSGGLRVVGGTQLESSPVVFSDRRLKTNLQPIPDALNKVSKLNGVYFNWIDEQVPGVPMDRDRHVGVIAQEVQRVVPEVVRKQHDTYFSVDYASLVPVLIEAIHDLQGLLQDVQSRQDKFVVGEQLNSTARRLGQLQQFIERIDVRNSQTSSLKNLIQSLQERVATLRQQNEKAKIRLDYLELVRTKREVASA